MGVEWAAKFETESEELKVRFTHLSSEMLLTKEDHASSSAAAK